MKNLVQHILEKNYTEAEREIDEAIPFIMEQKLLEMKKAVAAKMSEGKMGIVGPTTGQKRAMDVIEEEDLDEMKLDNEKPDYENVEDRRGTKDPNWFMKNKPVYPNSLGAPKPKSTQTINTSGKGDLQKEEEQLDEAPRIKIVRARIRGGKVQRRKKVSTVQGMTVRGGKLTRMSPAERRRRKMGQRRGKMKRRSKLTRTLMKRKRSLMRRKALGL